VSNNAARTITTVGIWVSMACLFIFGFFRASVSGVLPTIFWGAIGLALAAAAAFATHAVWKAASPAP
jgi:hypothetical protein